MATQAAAIDLLMNKGQFEPQVAVAIAEAVALTMTEAQVVTVPVLDSRLVALDHKVDLVESRLEKKIDLLRVNLETRIELVKMELENKIDAAVTRLEKAIEVTSAATQAELVRWVFIATVGSVFLQGMTSAIVNGFMRH
jgi:hypothetical protein